MFTSRLLARSRAAPCVLSGLERKQDPLAWAETQNRLGNILGAIGQQLHDAATFQKAADCFTVALDEYSQEANPQEWAATQANLEILRERGVRVGAFLSRSTMSAPAAGICRLVFR